MIIVDDPWIRRIACWKRNYYQDVSNSSVTFMVMYHERYLIKSNTSPIHTVEAFAGRALSATDLLTSKQASKDIHTCLLAKISVENLLACLLVSRAGNLLVTCLLA